MEAVMVEDEEEVMVVDDEVGVEVEVEVEALVMDEVVVAVVEVKDREVVLVLEAVEELVEVEEHGTSLALSHEVELALSLSAVKAKPPLHGSGASCLWNPI